MRNIIPVTALGGLATILSCAASAHASGLATARFGGEHGHPTTSNPTAVYYNPAGIGLSEGVNFFADGNFAWRIATYERPEICPPADTPTACDANASNNEFGEPNNAIGANYGKSALTNFVAAPMLGATVNIPIGSDYSLGIGGAFFVPFGGQSSWDKNEAFRDHPQYAGPVDGVARWWSIDGTLRSLFVSGAVSFSIQKLIHLGLSGGVAFSEVNTIRAKVLNNSNNLDLEGRAWIDASDVNGHLGGGVVVTPFKNDELRLGFSYQMPVGVNGVTMQGKLNLQTGQSGPAAVTEQDINLHHVWPDVFRLGAAYKPIESVELRLFGDVTRWNLFEDQCVTDLDTDTCRNDDGELVDGVILNIPRNWDVGFGVRAGGSWFVNDDIELYLGAGYDSNAIPDGTLEPALPDFDDVSLGLGGRFHVLDWWALAVTYTQIFYIERDTIGKSETAVPPDDKSLGPDSGGLYNQSIGFLNVNMQFSFDPFGSSEPAASDPAPEEEPLEDPEPEPEAEPTEEPEPIEEPQPTVEPMDESELEGDETGGAQKNKEQRSGEDEEEMLEQ